MTDRSELAIRRNIDELDRGELNTMGTNRICWLT